MKFEKLKKTLDNNFAQYKYDADDKKKRCGDFAFVLNDAVVSNDEISIPAVNS